VPAAVSGCSEISTTLRRSFASRATERGFAL